MADKSHDNILDNKIDNNNKNSGNINNKSDHSEEENDDKEAKERPLKKRRHIFWKSQQEEMLINAYDKLSVDPKYSTHTLIAQKMIDDGALPGYSLNAITSKLTRLLNGVYNKTNTPPIVSNIKRKLDNKIEKEKSIDDVSGGNGDMDHGDSEVEDKEEEKEEEEGKEEEEHEDADEVEEEEKEEYEEDNDEIPLKGNRLWRIQQEEMLMNIYNKALSTNSNVSQKAFGIKLFKDGTFPGFTSNAITSKLQRLIKESEKSTPKTPSSDNTINNTTKSNNITEKDTETTQTIKINDLEKKLHSQHLQIQQLQQKLQSQSQQLQQQKLQLKQQNQPPQQPLNNNTTNTKLTTTDNLLPVNKDTRFISSNSAIIIKSSTSLNNQDIYVLFPTVASCESIIKSVKTIDGRHHVEIKTKSKTFTNTSFHYITQFDPSIYHDPEICKIRYNQVENNGLFFKKREIHTYDFSD